VAADPPASTDSPAGPPLLRLEGVDLGYGSTTLLGGLDLEVQPGERIAICGPNGAGKTTLLRGLLGLLPPQSGRLERQALRMGFVPQREGLDALFPVSTRELVLQGAVPLLSGTRRLPAEARVRAEALLRRLGLSEQAGTLLAHLSGGQRQRALLARALMVDPELLVLDEPTSGVDLEAAEAVFDQVDRCVREDGVAALIVTHQFEQLADRVDRVWWVADGQVRVVRPEGFDPARLLGRRAGDRPGVSSTASAEVEA
jgi:ABC-type Mn2+/Zn2+ transport system ATPase subunit